MTCRRVLKGGEMDYGVFSNRVFSPHVYIRSSPYRPNRDPNWTLSNELLLLLYSAKVVILRGRASNFKTVNSSRE